MAATCGRTTLQTQLQTPFGGAHLRCESQPGAAAQPLNGLLNRR
ncbi:MAG: hypothetical protein ACKO2P_10550 [Planctomycetota bacterium]